MPIKMVKFNGRTVTTLHDDRLAGMMTKAGAVKIERASNVEFALVDQMTQWDVVLSDHELNGAFKGMVVLSDSEAIERWRAKELAVAGQYRGFPTRREALDVEVAFLNNLMKGGQHAPRKA